MPQWYQLVHPMLPPAVNMAVDQHLFNQVEQGQLDRPVLRLYAWDRPTLSLGYHQSHRRAVDMRQLQAASVALVRRPTGGRAVLHHLELTYALVAPLKDPFSTQVSQNYSQIAQALHRFSHRFGPGPEIHQAAMSPKKMGSSPCFASLSSSEIASNTKKLIGSSQKMGKRAFLQHGSIPIYNHSDLLVRVTGTALEMKNYMTSISELCQESDSPTPELGVIQTYFWQAFKDHFSVEFTPFTCDPQSEPIQNLIQTTFGQESFTLRK